MRARPVKQVQLNLPVREYTIQQLNRLGEKELRKEYSRLRSIARKRLERLQASEFKNYEFVKQQAGFEPLKNLHNKREVAYMVADVAHFLSLESSTISGIKAHRERIIGRLHEVGFEGVTESNYSDVSAILDELHAGGEQMEYYSPQMVEDILAEYENLSPIEKEYARQTHGISKLARTGYYSGGN